MQAKLRCTKRHKPLHRFTELLARHAVLCLTRIAHDGIAEQKLAAGVKAQAYRLGDAAVPGKKIDMCDIIQIDQHTHLTRKLIFSRRRFI
ncbi:hypothetical protein SDC9_190235 [bioreactor metagenome]|uniref:Uncharacterized protein n=1 Tax=bioreactor metagenome TaxID=1076179 RepID=A0A645HUG9_9ZZZZ